MLHGNKYIARRCWSSLLYGATQTHIMNLSKVQARNWRSSRRALLVFRCSFYQCVDNEYNWEMNNTYSLTTNTTQQLADLMRYRARFVGWWHRSGKYKQNRRYGLMLRAAGAQHFKLHHRFYLLNWKEVVSLFSNVYIATSVQ